MNINRNYCVIAYAMPWHSVHSPIPVKGIPEPPLVIAWIARYFFALAQRKETLMGKVQIQVVTAMTLDGFLPEPAGTLVSWVRNDRRGFPFWRERCSALILPHSILDLLCDKDNRGDSFTYLAEIINSESVELLRGLFLYDLVDELVVYQLPYSAGQGISVLDTFRPQHWELHKTTSFSNGICRLIYRKPCRM